MRKLFTKSSLCIAAGTTVSGVSDKPETFQVTSGKVWITIEGSLDDYWLESGESISVDAGRLIVIEADKQDSRINLPHAHDVHRSFDFFGPLRALAHGASGTSQHAEC